MAGHIAYVVGFFVALVMWGWGLLWFSFAIASLVKTARDVGVPFNMGWWGFTYVSTSPSSPLQWCIALM